jgi:hypothetical protein
MKMLSAKVVRRCCYAVVCLFWSFALTEETVRRQMGRHKQPPWELWQLPGVIFLGLAFVGFHILFAWLHDKDAALKEVKKQQKKEGLDLKELREQAKKIAHANYN